MPAKRCTVNSKGGWKWGDSGKCYTGPGAKNKALRQGRAIKVNSSNRMHQILTAVAEILHDKKKT